jgi:hypothetical protein
MTQPFTVVVVFSAATKAPVFALSNYGLGTLDSDELLYYYTRVPIKAQIEAITVDEVRSAALGLGLPMRTVKFVIKNSGPFFDEPFSKWLYAAGATVDDFFFAVWTTDYSKSLEDITASGVFFGYYKLSAGLAWSESEQATTITLVDMVTMMSSRYNENTADAEQILEGSEWQNLLTAPAYYGYRAGVRAVGRAIAAISGFESYKNAVLGVIAGKVQSSVLVGTSINLGKSPALADLVGDTVKLKMGNGCLISGAITDIGDGNYGINTTGLALNQAWDSITVYNKGYTVPSEALGFAATNLQSVFIDNAIPLTRIPSPLMYLKSPGTVSFYASGAQISAGAVFLKLTGIADEANKEYTCEELKNPDEPTWYFSGVNVQFYDIQQSTNFSDPDLLHLTYAKWLAPQTWSLYFTNDTYVLDDIQREGMAWELIVTPHVNTDVALTHVFYCRLIGNTIIAETVTGQLAIYANDGKSLLPISPSDIASVSYGNTDFDMVDLCKITLKRSLLEIDASVDPNFLQVDTGPPIYAGDCIAEILTQGGIPWFTRGSNTRPGTSQLGNAMSLEITDETWTQLLDSVLFESGLQLDASDGIYKLTPNFTKALVHTWNRGESGERYLTVQTQGSIAYGDILDGMYKFDIGRMATSIDAERREFVRVHYTFQYPIAAVSGTALRKLQSVKAAKSNDRTIDYTFKHITDTTTATAAAVQMTRIGHTANIPETTRTVTVGLPLSYMNLQVLDVINLDSFKFITAKDSPLPEYDPDATNPVYTLGPYGVYMRYDDTTEYALIPGLGVVDSVSINLGGDGPPVTVVFRQVQFGTSSNLYDVALNVALNTEAENTTASAESDVTRTPNYPIGTFPCPPGFSGTFHVKINPGSRVAGQTLMDACCNIISTESDSTVDAEIVVACQPGIGEDPWPDTCYDPIDVRYEPLHGYVVVNVDTMLFKLISTLKRPPQLVSIAYAGQKFPDLCVIWAPRKNETFHAWFGTLYVKPCIFDLPENLYFKCIELLFSVEYCLAESIPIPFTSAGGVSWDSVIGNAVRWRSVYKTVLYRVSVPIVLREVSTISITGS